MAKPNILHFGVFLPSLTLGWGNHALDLSLNLDTPITVRRIIDEQFLATCYDTFLSNAPGIKPYFADADQFDETLARIADKKKPALRVQAPRYPRSHPRSSFMPSYANAMRTECFYDPAEAARHPYLTSGHCIPSKELITVVNDRSAAQTQSILTRQAVHYLIAHYLPESEQHPRPLLLNPATASAPVSYDRAVHELTDLCLQGDANKDALFEHRWQAHAFNGGTTLEEFNGLVRVGSILGAIGTHTLFWPGTLYAGSYLLGKMVKGAQKGKILKQKAPTLTFQF